MCCVTVGENFHTENDHLVQMDNKLKELDESIMREFDHMLEKAKKKAKRGPLIPPISKWPKPLRRFLGTCMLPIFVPLGLTMPFWAVPYWIITGKCFDNVFENFHAFVFQKVMPDYVASSAYCY